MKSTRMIRKLTWLLLALTIPAVMWMACNDKPNDPTNPDRLIAVNGSYYRGELNQSTVHKPMSVKITDRKGNGYASYWIKFALTEGDGTLSADSILTAANGIATIEYTIDGQLSYGTIRASYGKFNPVDLYVRASLIESDSGGQGDYVLFDDVYQDVLNFLGTPQGTAEDPNFWINYAEYLDSTGVVVIIRDDDSSTTISPFENVAGVILTSELDSITKDTVYAFRGKTRSGLGIGSTPAEFKIAFGPPNLKEFDPTYPPALVYRYDPVGAIVYFDTVNTAPGDTLAMEIHVTDKGKDPTTLAKRRGLGHRASAREYRGYHHIRQ